jgi:hypothetical protein
MQARFYSPHLGRFISPDTTLGNLIDRRDHNAFAYAWNDPVALKDPTGHGVGRDEGSTDESVTYSVDSNGNVVSSDGYIQVPGLVIDASVPGPENQPAGDPSSVLSDGYFTNPETAGVGTSLDENGSPTASQPGEASNEGEGEAGEAREPGTTTYSQYTEDGEKAAKENEVSSLSKTAGNAGTALDYAAREAKNSGTEAGKEFAEGAEKVSTGIGVAIAAGNLAYVAANPDMPAFEAWKMTAEAFGAVAGLFGAPFGPEVSQALDSVASGMMEYWGWIAHSTATQLSDPMLIQVGGGQ